MPEELGTRDVLEQVDARMGNIEQDLRAFRSEVKDDLRGLRSEMNDRFAEVNGRFASVDQRLMWIYGLLVTVLLGVVGLWFK